MVHLGFQYDNVLRSLLDRHAPIKQRVVTVRPSAPWYSSEIAQNQRIRRKLERKWRSTLLPSDRELYVHQCSVVNNLIDSAKSTYYTTVITDFSGDQKMLFKTVNKLLQKQKVQQYPSCFPDSTSLSSVKLTRYTMHLQGELLRMTSVYLILLIDLCVMRRFTTFNKLLWIW